MSDIKKMSDFTDLERKCYLVAERRAYEHHFLKLIKAGAYGHNCFTPKQHAKYMFFTINPKPHVNIEAIKTAMSKTVSKTWIQAGEYYYVYEQRKTEEHYVTRPRLQSNTVGFHIHMILFAKKKPCHAQREIYNTFKDYVGNVKHIDYKQYKMDVLPKSFAYIKGNKQASKMPHAYADPIMRKELLLKQYYTNISESEDDRFLNDPSHMLTLSGFTPTTTSTPDQVDGDGFFKPKKLKLKKKKHI